MSIVEQKKATMQATHEQPCNTAIKIGGTTVGSIALGSAIGTAFSPAGAVVGAVVGGFAGAAASTAEALMHRARKQ